MAALPVRLKEKEEASAGATEEEKAQYARYIEANIDAAASYGDWLSLDEGKRRNYDHPFFTEWLRRGKWCEKFTNYHPADTIGLEASYGAKTRYAHYTESIQNYEMVCELGWTPVMEVLSKELHYHLRWCRIFREHFPESVELLKARAVRRRCRAVYESAFEDSARRGAHIISVLRMLRSRKTIKNIALAPQTFVRIPQEERERLKGVEERRKEEDKGIRKL